MFSIARFCSSINSAYDCRNSDGCMWSAKSGKCVAPGYLGFKKLYYYRKAKCGAISFSDAPVSDCKSVAVCKYDQKSKKCVPRRLELLRISPRRADDALKNYFEGKKELVAKFEKDAAPATLWDDGRFHLQGSDDQAWRAKYKELGNAYNYIVRRAAELKKNPPKPVADVAATADEEDDYTGLDPESPPTSVPMAEIDVPSEDPIDASRYEDDDEGLTSHKIQVVPDQDADLSEKHLESFPTGPQVFSHEISDQDSDISADSSVGNADQEDSRDVETTDRGNADDAEDGVYDASMDRVDNFEAYKIDQDFDGVKLGQRSNTIPIFKPSVSPKKKAGYGGLWNDLLAGQWQYSQPGLKPVHPQPDLGAYNFDQDFDGDMAREWSSNFPVFEAAIPSVPPEKNVAYDEMFTDSSAGQWQYSNPALKPVAEEEPLSYTRRTEDQE